MKKTLIIACLSVIAGLTLGFFLFRGGHSHDSETSSAGEPGATAAEIWTCSMHPQVQAPKPGKCPICAMDLIPLTATVGGGGERSFSMSETAKKLAEITTTEVTRGHPEAVIRLFGKVMYDETKMKTIAARFPARIDKLFVDYTGILVKQGDHLATLYSPELLSAQTELLTAKKFNNPSAAEITRDKLRLWGFSDSRIAAIESSGKTSDQLTIDAPSSGIVTHKNVNEGDYVETGSPFFKIADLSEVWVMLDAYESDTPWLRFGQQTEFTTESLPGKTFKGRISFIAPELDPSTRTVSVRVNLPNEEGMLKPGMFVSGVVTAKVAGAGQVLDPSLAGKWISPMHPEIVKDGPGKCDVCGMDLVPAEQLGYVASADALEPPLLIPAGAVLHTGKRSVVYVELPDKEQPTYEGREVLIGPRAGDQYIVEAGLREGERVVSQGGFVIDSALQIQAKSSMMLPGEGSEPLYPHSPASDEFLTQSDKLLRSYFSVHKGLAGDSLTEAASASETALKQLADLSTKELPAPSTLTWEQLSERLEPGFQAIATADSIESARAEFQKLSKTADEFVRRFGTAHLPVYEHYCPMAFDNAGGSWLQTDEALLNPYFGAKMLRCGEVRDQLASVKSIALNDEGNAAVKTLLSDYLAVQSALTKDSLEEAKSTASALASKATDLADQAKSNPDAAIQLEQLGSRLKTEAQSASETADLPQFRANFKTLSTLIESLVVSFGAELESPLFKAHCPMAFDNAGGDWLQAGEEINNPYFGASMLGCGEITAQLAGVKQPSSEDKEHIHSHSEAPKQDSE